MTAEYGVIRTYLEWIIELPWGVSTEDNLDIAHAREVLDADHYDLEKVKDRILEYLAVRKLPIPGRLARARSSASSGPPGVGKTSLGRSIAKALGREFERISVGGVRDEAEIRGHRRTYIGAMPGTIVRALRDAGSRNPVFMIDEIDKMGADFRGDPVERHARGPRPGAERQLPRPLPGPRVRPLGGDVHHDGEHARDGDRPPLQDRMEVIHLAGYTLDEKLHIAKRYLVPRQIEQNGLVASRISFTDAALRAIVEEYTREAGVRNLEREIGTRLPQGRARGRRGKGRREGDDLRPSGRESCSAAPLLRRAAAPHQGPRASRRGSPGRRSAARSCSSRRPRCPATAS